MNSPPDKIGTLSFFAGLSVLVHLLLFISLGRFGNYNFAPPVNPLQAVMLDLAKTRDEAAPSDVPEVQEADQAGKATDIEEADENQPGKDMINTAAPVNPEKRPVETDPTNPAVSGQEKAGDPQPVADLSTSIIPPLRTASEFMTTRSEKLTYLISLRGVPVGRAELEAKNINGEVRISLRTRSNSALSGIYPVDDLMETRHIAGNFIISKIRQQEGAFRSDIGYTIFLRDKKVFWIDCIKNRYSNETIPNSDVLDTLSSFYYLRSRPLQSGKTEILDIYDGDNYASVPMEILRREEIRLRNFKTVDTLLLRHVKQKGGIFRRTGDMLIWLTDDGNRVPVKMETTFPLGKVTAELVSAETLR